jgi:hypothetical protein
MKCKFARQLVHETSCKGREEDDAVFKVGWRMIDQVKRDSASIFVSCTLIH